MQHWAKEELQGVQLGDVRLNRRLVQIVDRRDIGSTADS
jgi:Transposase DNA-binding